MRVAAARALGARSHRASVQKLEAALNGKRLPTSDLTEKMAFFEAYGALVGDAGVAMLDGMLNKKGLFGKREDAELRACAALALDVAPTAPWRAAPGRHGQGSVVRNAVNRARGGTS